MAKLTFTYAVMDAGKTTHLLQMNHNFKNRGFKVKIIKPLLDTRDGTYLHHTNHPITSRLIKDDDTLACYLSNISEQDVLQPFIPDIVLADEAQFFSEHDIDVLSDIVDKHNIPVYCYGLRTDSNGHLFSGSARLLAIADKINELKCACRCGNKATTHIKIVDGEPVFDDNSVAIEKNNIYYESVCRKCWKRLKEKSSQ